MDVVRVSAVVLRDAQRRVLTVRKHGTSAFMLPGGKPEQGEGDVAAAIRECREELDIVLDQSRLQPLGTFEAAAANEPGHTVHATVFTHPFVEVGSPKAEIAEIAWVGPDEARIAPLLRDAVFPALRDRPIRQATVVAGFTSGDSPLFATRPWAARQDR